MKNKIFKLLSVVLALTMIFSTCLCAISAHAEEAETVVPVMVQGTVDGQTGEIIPTVLTRISSEELYAIADFEKATVASGYKAYFHFYDAEGNWKSSCGGWKYGEVAIGTLSGITSETVSFRIVVGPDGEGNLAPADFPADGLVLTKKVVVEEPETPVEPENPEVEDSITYTPEMTMGNVVANVGNGLVFNTSVNTRITSKELIPIADIEKVEIGTGYKAWYYTYTADGILTTNANGEVKGCNAWKEGTYTAEDLQKISAEGVYFSVTVATLNNDAFAEAVLPEGACVITKVIRPEMVQGNVKTAEGGGLVINSTVGTRITTKELLPITDYKKVKVGAGYKAWYYTYDADGILTNTSGSGKWVEGDYTAMALMGLSDKAVYFSVTLGTTNNDNLTPDTLPKEAFALIKAPAPVIPEMAQGNVKTSEGNLTLDSSQGTRITTKELIPLAAYEKIELAAGYKAWYYVYKADGSLVPGTGAGAWKEGDYAVSDLAALSADAVYFSVTVATTNNDAITPETLPEGTLKLIELGAYGACLEHKVPEYKSDENATCLEDGTKSGTCTVCGEKVTIKDEYTAFGHKFDDANDTECNNACGYIRDLAVPCEHDYRKYTSNNDATCTEDGTKSATCLLCGEVNTIADEGTKLGHKADYVSNNDATCDQNATQTGVCERCTETVTIDIENSALGHKYNSDDDDYCAVCGTERTRYTYYVYAGNLGGVDSNDGLTAETPLATIEKAIQLANEKGATIGDIVELKLSGTVTWGGSIDGNWETITAHEFKLILTSEEGTAYAAGTKNVILGGPVTYNNVVLDAGNSWKSFLANGNDFVFGTGFASDMFDLALGDHKDVAYNRDATFTFNAFFPKIWVGNSYNVATFNKKYTLNLNSNLLANGTADERDFTLVLGGNSGKTKFNGIASIINNSPNGIIFKEGSRVEVGENGAFNVINKNADKLVDITTIGLSDAALAKAWVLNANNMATLDATDVAGEFAVQMGYIATATPVEGDAITSAAGKLVLPAGQYTISFAICQEHVYDGDTDATCNACGAIREVYIPCEHEWGEFVFDNNATCESLGTETATCTLCFETKTQDIEGEAAGHIYDDDADMFCNVCDMYKILEPTLVKCEDGVWRYYVNGEWDQTATTLHWLAGKWFFVENGVWSKASRFVMYKGVEFYVSGGKWDKTLTDLKWVDGKWYYIKNGKPARNVDTLHKINGKWFLVKKGIWNKTTGIVEYKDKEFFVQGGKWKSQETLYKKGGKYLAIKGGKWYKSKGIVKYNGKKFYVNKGYAQTSYSGKVTINGKKYTVKKGKIA